MIPNGKYKEQLLPKPKGEYPVLTSSGVTEEDRSIALQLTEKISEVLMRLASSYLEWSSSTGLVTGKLLGGGGSNSVETG